jgi:protein-tyrosine phosphatase
MKSKILHKRIDVLFVCLGNICRSPTAEAVMTELVDKAGLSENIFCDSAGTNGLHDGERADPRSIAQGKKRGYNLTSISRKFNPSKDFESFSYIVVMDDRNLRDVRALDRNMKFQDSIFKMVDYCNKHKCGEVPDPYYGEADGFDLVIDILEDACAGLLQQIKTEHGF